MAKAVTFTITFFLLGTTLLALSFLILDIAQSTERRTTEFAINNRVNDLSASISKGLVDIFLAEAGINITVTNNTLSIQEIIPNPRLDNYVDRVENFTSFVESREPYVTLNVGDVNRTRLIIMPVNSTFYNENFGDDTDKRFITNFINIDSITFDVYEQNIPVEAIDWQEFIGGQTTVTAIFRNNTRTLTETRNADLVGDDRGDEFRVTFYQGGTGTGDSDDIDFEVRDGDLLKAFDLRFNTTTNMTITFDADETITVYMNNPIIISVPEFNITKVTYPRIV